jgi:hypothetical protein
MVDEFEGSDFLSRLLDGFAELWVCILSAV